MRSSLILLAISACILTSCAKKVTTKNNANCDGVMCTMLFAMITVNVQDASGQPIILDSCYTLRTSNNEKIYHTNSGTLNNAYTVLDDGDRKSLINTTDHFAFIGYRNGVKIVNEPYVLGADCCHVNKQSGNNTITIP